MACEETRSASIIGFVDPPNYGIRHSSRLVRTSKVQRGGIQNSNVNVVASFPAVASLLKVVGPRFQTIGLLVCSNLFMTFAVLSYFSYEVDDLMF